MASVRSLELWILLGSVMTTSAVAQTQLDFQLADANRNLGISGPPLTILRPQAGMMPALPVQLFPDAGVQFSPGGSWVEQLAVTIPAGAAESPPVMFRAPTPGATPIFLDAGSTAFAN